MKFSTLIIPIYVISASAVVIPPSTTSDTNIAGSIVPSNDATGEVDTVLADLTTEYQKLEVLKKDLFDLHHKVCQQEHDILKLINKDYASCSGLRCYVQTAVKQAPNYFQLVKIHFRHHPQNATGHDALEVQTPKEDSIVESSHHDLSDLTQTDSESNDPHVPADKPFNFDEDKHHPPFHFDHETSPDRPCPAPEPITPFDHADQPFDFGPPDHWQRPGGRPDHHGPPSEHHGERPPHPFRPHHPEYNADQPNSEPPAVHPNSRHGPHHPFRMPHPAPRHRHFKLILVTAGMTVTLLILAILFKSLHVYLSNPRVQADRAARREECRTKREYRRAACQHRFRQLFRFRRRRCLTDAGTDDYEEKRAALMQQHHRGSSSHIVGADIESLRRAHEIVDRLVRAEEGRHHHHHHRERSRSVDTTDSSRSARSLQTTRTVTTLPPYAPPPPRYSMELRRELDVADGYSSPHHHSRAAPPDETVSLSSADTFVFNDEDLCTESSVVDCQSRMSLDTDTVTSSVAEEDETRPLREKGSDFALAGDRYRGRFG